jgi:hypothetical protein
MGQVDTLSAQRGFVVATDNYLLGSGGEFDSPKMWHLPLL